MNQKIQEEIKLKTELLKTLLILLLADLAAVISLIKDNTGKPMELVYVILGIFSIFGLSIVAIVGYAHILSLIKKA